MRRAVLRIGEVLAAGGVIAYPDDVFFLTRGRGAHHRPEGSNP
jgi:hypothetical protein